MAIVVVEAVAPVASWRPPEALTYHRTLPLPPYTALVGVLGAAVGLDLVDAYRFVAERGLRLGVGGWHEGQARDLWKFQKLESIADPKKEIVSDVLLRELWIETRLVLVVEAPDSETAETVADAFRRPVFPLTAGPSDALMHAVAARVEDANLQSTRRLAHAMVYGEISPRYRLFEALTSIPLSRIIRAPTIERLPFGFIFETGSPRRLVGRDLVSFVSDPIELDEAEDPILGYAVEPQSSFLRHGEVFQTLQEAAPWIIPVHRYDSPTMPAANFSTGPSPNARPPRKNRPSSPTGNM